MVAVDMVRGINSPAGLLPVLRAAHLPHGRRHGGDHGVRRAPADPAAPGRLLRPQGVLGSALHRQPAGLDRPGPPAPRHRPGRGRLGPVLRDARRGSASGRRPTSSPACSRGRTAPEESSRSCASRSRSTWGRGEPRRAGYPGGTHRGAGRRRPVSPADRGTAVGGDDVRTVARWHGHQRRGGGGPARAPRRRTHQGGAGRVRRPSCARRWRGSGSTPAYVGTAEDLLTPVVFCALDPPEDPPLLFYRLPIAPDLTLTKDDVPWDLVRDVPVLWVTGTGVSTSSRRARPSSTCSPTGDAPTPAAGRWTVLDLDWRPMFWPSPQDARREYELMLEHVDRRGGQPGRGRGGRRHGRPRGGRPPAARPRSRAGAGQEGRRGRARRDPRRDDTVAPQLVDVVCGLGAGDAFGGALVHGLLSGWDPVRIAEYGNAAGAIVVAQLACADAMPTARGARDHGRRTVAGAVTARRGPARPDPTTTLPEGAR